MFLKFNGRAVLPLAALLLLLLPAVALSQEGWPKLIGSNELERVVPQGFYFEGQSAPTQMRNSAAAQLGSKRFVISGLVDTSGYSSDVQAKYQGFLITDSPITVGGESLATGAYGFGFNSEGWMDIMDVGGRRVLSVRTRVEERMQRPRPLMMTAVRDGIRLYSGKSFVLISAR